MRKLNGITINGEYLGNSVVINGMFRAICTISPVIMRDFVVIINKIDDLEESVKIHNFNCGFDCIDIEFENKTSRGMASLYFKLHDGEPILKDCKLVINDEEYNIFQDRINLHSKDMTNPNKPLVQKQSDSQNSELDRLQKIRELREKKQAMQKQKGGSQNIGAPNSAQRMPNPQQPQNLTPEQLKEKKRQELLEKKRKLLEARKAKSGMNSASETSALTSDTEDGNTEGSGDTATKSAANSKTNDTKKVETPPSTIVTQSDGTVTNEQGQELKKEERVKEDGTISEVYVNPENPSEVYEQNENGEFVNENSVANESDMSDSNDNYEESGGSSILDNLSDEDLENMSDEELAALEAELNAELDNNYASDDSFDSGYPSYDSNAGYSSGGLSPDFAEKLSQGLADGLTMGLTQGLSQGIAQGLAQGFSDFAANGGFGNQNTGAGFGNNAFDNAGFGNQNAGAGFGNNAFDNGGFGNSFNDTAPAGNQSASIPQMPNYIDIDTMNAYASDSAKDAYSYDENSDLDDISDFYSDFYDSVQEQAEQNYVDDVQYQNNVQNEGLSEAERLKAELEALKAQAQRGKQLMSVEDFMAAQREIKDAKDKLCRQRMKIVGSKGRINTSALDGGIFADGKKLYKWGDTRVLDK